MSEKNNINEFDLMMKSILEEGQEEVPARIWDGVSEGLDKAARRTTVVLWFRRAAAGAAAAAAVMAGVFFNSGRDETLVPEAADSDMIAVVEQVVIPDETESVTAHDYVAMAREDLRESMAEDKHMPEVPMTAADATEAAKATEASAATTIQTHENKEVTPTSETPTHIKENAGEKGYLTEEWVFEDEVKKKRRNVLYASASS